jgi:hypothetical protein
MNSISTFTTTHDDGTKVRITIQVTQDHYPTWAKWLRVYLESPIAYGLKEEE